MPKVYCCLCSKRVETNKSRVRIGSDSVWSLIQIHAVKMSLDVNKLSREDIICMKCYSVVSHYRMTDRGPNKKIKASVEIDPQLVITKDVLRSALRTEEISSATPMGMTINSSLKIILFVSCH